MHLFLVAMPGAPSSFLLLLVRHLLLLAWHLLLLASLLLLVRHLLLEAMHLSHSQTGTHCILLHIASRSILSLAKSQKLEVTTWPWHQVLLAPAY